MPETDDVQAVLATNLRRLMETHASLRSQPALAKRAGVDQKTISRVLAAENAPSITVVAKIARAFGLEAWMLLTRQFNPQDPPARAMRTSEHDALRQVLLAADTMAKYRDN